MLMELSRMTGFTGFQRANSTAKIEENLLLIFDVSVDSNNDWFFTLHFDCRNDPLPQRNFKPLVHTFK